MILWSRASLSDVNYGIFIVLCLHNNVVLDSKVCFYLKSQASNQSGLFHRSIVVTLPIGIWVVAVAHLTERSIPIPYCKLFESYYLWLQRFKRLLKHFLSKFLHKKCFWHILENIRKNNLENCESYKLVPKQICTYRWK